MSIDEYHTAYGRAKQPFSVGYFLQHTGMWKKESKFVLWENVSRLMSVKYGKENLTRLAKDAGFGPGTSTRLKEQTTSVGVDTLEKLGRAFSVEPWQLLVPELDPKELPKVSSEWGLPLVPRHRFLALDADRRAVVQGYLMRVIEEQEVSMASAMQEQSVNAHAA